MHDCQLLVLAYSGRMIPAEDVKHIKTALESDPDYRLEFDHLVLLAPDADYSHFPPEISEDHARRYVAHHRANSSQPKRMAFVCSNDVQQVIAKLFAAYVHANGPSLLEAKTFSTLTAALDWIEPVKGPARKFDRQKLRTIIRDLGQGWCLGKRTAA